MKIELHQFTDTKDWKILISTDDGDMVASVPLNDDEVEHYRGQDEHVLMTRFMDDAGIDDSCVICRSTVTT